MNDRVIVLAVFMFSLSVVPCLSGQSIAAMTYNIRYINPNDGENWWELRKDEVADLVNYYEPDFLGIQEGLYAQVTFIEDKCSKYDYIGVGRDDGKKKGEYTAVYFDKDKFELLSQETFWLSPTPSKVSVGWDASMERICTYGHFKLKNSGTTVHIFNTHFDHKGPEARANSAKLIVGKLKKLGIENDRIIVMGDLNCLPESEPIINFQTLLDDTALISPKPIYGPIGTFNRFDPQFIPHRRIDYIFSKNLQVLDHRIIDDRRKNNLWPSDHLPVLVRFEN